MSEKSEAIIEKIEALVSKVDALLPKALAVVLSKDECCPVKQSIMDELYDDMMGFRRAVNSHIKDYKEVCEHHANQVLCEDPTTGTLSE